MTGPFTRVDARRVVVVGVTGSIGRQAVEVIERSPRLTLVGAVAAHDAAGLQAAGRRLGCDHLALVHAEPKDRRWEDADPAGFLRLAAPDLVLNAAVGVAGLPWTLATIDAGADLALANKESLVAGGTVITERLAAGRSRLLPVDSEHSALHQLMEAYRPSVVTMTITASGGPFRNRRWADLRGVSVDAALHHPTWSMGPKNTLDSATLVNKGLELIEASYLFGLPEQQIDVAVQPRSVVHASVRLRDGTEIATLSRPDMRRSISYALHHPDVVDIGLGTDAFADLGVLELEPAPADYPAIGLARRALRDAAHGGTAAYNAANEEAVAAFLAGRIRFTDVTDVIERALDQLPRDEVGDIAAVMRTDALARASARAKIEDLAIVS